MIGTALSNRFREAGCKLGEGGIRILQTLLRDLTQSQLQVLKPDLPVDQLDVLHLANTGGYRPLPGARDGFDGHH